MTRCTADNSLTNPAYRRRTMATGEMKEFLGIKGTEPTDFGINSDAQDLPSPSRQASTRRMSIGESIDGKINDWEEPRLDIEGFVVDYFTHRIRQNGMEWFGAPGLPCGVQPEHEMMRVMGTIFEKKHAENFETFCEQLLAVPRISFSLYQDVVRTVGNAQTDQCPMSYGRLIGLISFGGFVAAKMMESVELQGQVRNLFVYTSLFIKTRIRNNWKEHNRSWDDFMTLGKQMKEDYERAEAEKVGRRKQNRRWSMIGAGVTAGAIGIVGVVVCGRMMFSLK
ncbi:Apoptosis regulator ced-9 [Caenorhabditis elegans]|uniref:Apoptosis regulator ced-9 n=1 Tax=Caenorhabditis elegans TaxID=6239 RepID=CED9_CAEEL|nr:Apoptosis regulator ced-9 [Caenorhabditis elegans]P41958.1 RecName: Full=Apoptosis regulator ced-9; AltName: Full=Cell death protein 9 [Caenorhabditis elegans]AAA20080.1 CED-9 [Caenorhabditis elegans]CAA82573.2 Apoptosis regulator ced-9 [Caenorhabditis elegans]|eukprot:NP_499284.1 Apoptosis regulator ced-9 [Caenorhabditis elegans]